MATLFGAYFAELRREGLGLTLRKFCELNDFDPGNISKLERGRQAPPRKSEKIHEYAKALELEEGTDEWIEFLDRAAASRREFPEDLHLDEEVEAKLPVLFRSLRGEQLSEDEFDRLVDLLRRS